MTRSTDTENQRPYEGQRGMDDRAVSEVLSFVLVFSILLSSVVLVGLVGFQSIEDYHENERLGNAERAMTAFGDNVNDIVRYDGVDRRSGELALRGGTVEPGANGAELNVSVYPGDPSTTEPDWNSTDNYSGDIGAFTYETDDDTIAYEGGAVFRASSDGSVALTEPTFTVRDDTVLISLVVINTSERSIQSPEGVEFDVRETNATRFYTDDANVTVDVSDGPADPSNAAAWNRTFENDAEWARNGDDEWAPVTGSHDLNVSIDVVEVEIEYPEPG